MEMKSSGVMNGDFAARRDQAFFGLSFIFYAGD
jgi:hypothetical protein